MVKLGGSCSVWYDALRQLTTTTTSAAGHAGETGQVRDCPRRLGVWRAGLWYARRAGYNNDSPLVGENRVRLHDLSGRRDEIRGRVPPSHCRVPTNFHVHVNNIIICIRSVIVNARSIWVVPDTQQQHIIIILFCV